MRRTKSTLLLLILIVSGLVIGSFIGELLKDVVNLFAYSKSIGFSPVTIDLAFVQFTVGFVLEMNLASIIGLVIALIFYRWL